MILAVNVLSHFDAERHLRGLAFRPTSLRYVLAYVRKHSLGNDVEFTTGQCTGAVPVVKGP